MDPSVIAIIALTVGLPLVILVWAFGQFRKDTAGIKNGIAADAVVESIAETGTTISSPSVGPEAPVYRFGLLVTPPGGGAPYQAETTHAVPRLYVPMVMPGTRMGVKIDPRNPLRVVPDWNRLNAPALDTTEGAAGVGTSSRTVTMTYDGVPAAGTGGWAGAGGGTGAGGWAGAAPTLSFDTNGVPSAGGVESLVGAVRSGSVPTIRGSAATILATDTHGTAIITTAMPLGKTAGQVNPSIDPSQANDPIWVFTVEVTLAGQAPFPAVFGHRVPVAKVAALAPGVRLTVAVDPQNPNQDVAIDWDRSPLGATA